MDNVSMAVIDKNSPVVGESSEQFWADELTNAKILLNGIDLAINAFNSNGNIQSYTIDTGQSKQTVTRNDLGSLFAQRDRLIGQIATLEARLGRGGGVTQICPGF